MVDILIHNLENEEWFDKTKIEFSEKEQMNMSLDEIRKYACLVNWNLITKNPNIGKKFILENLDKNWNWRLIFIKYCNFSSLRFFEKHILQNPQLKKFISNDTVNHWISHRIIEKYPDLQWNWDILSGRSDNMPLKTIQKTLHKKWNWGKLHNNECLTLIFISLHFDKEWNWKKLIDRFNIKDSFFHLGKNINWKHLSKFIMQHYDSFSCITNFTVALVKKNQTKPWDWYKLTPCVGFDFIMANPEKQWDWYNILLVYCVSIEFIQQNLDKPLNWIYVTEKVCEKHAYFIIHQNPDKQWNFLKLSTDKNLDLDLVNKFPEKPWKWNNLSNYPVNLNFNVLNDNISKPWDYSKLSKNRNLPFDIVLAHPDKPWNWTYLSTNQNLPMKLIRQLPNKPWDWDNLSKYVTMDIIEQFPEKPWNFKKVSQNKNINIHVFKQFKSKIWDTKQLVCNLSATVENLLKNKKKLIFVTQHHQVHFSDPNLVKYIASFL